MSLFHVALVMINYPLKRGTTSNAVSRTGITSEGQVYVNMS